MDTDDKPKRTRKRQRRSAGLGCVYQRPGSKLWSIKWVEDGETRYKSGYPTRELAEQVLAVVAANIVKEQAGIPVERPPAPKLRDLIGDWLKRREHTHRSHRDDRNRWKKHLAPAFGERR